MSAADRRRQIEDVCHAALEQDPTARASFIAGACGSDEDLRREVAALLAHAQTAEGFLATPLEAVAAQVLREAPASLVGRALGPYQIQARLGSGGMGEVYRAQDTILGRDVAIKILLRAFLADADRRARFDREARLLAALNHPNIGAIYGVERTPDGTPALILELVQGPTLADRIAEGPIPIPEALAVAKQIADALSAAHEAGVIHRDLKPANIKVRPDGTVKILDFGLAKVWDGAPQSDLSGSPRLTATDLTGRPILGTPAYMSPEQARGQSLDRRTDIWSFGCVLYEMLTGRAPFAGHTISDTLDAVLHSGPDWAALPKKLPVAVRTLIRRCLEKQARQRIADISVALFVLDDPERQAPPAAMPAARLRLWQGLAALGALTALGLVGWTIWSKPAPGYTSRFEARIPEGVELYAYVSVSPDGRKLAFTEGTKALWVRDFSTLEWRRLPGTELALSPFWSPDSRYLAFAAGNQLKKIDIAGGPPQTLCSLPMPIDGSGTWNRNGVIVFGSSRGGAGGPLWKISETGGAATAITEVDTSKRESSHMWPTFIEDGEHFVYFRSGTPDIKGIYAGSLDATPAEQARTRILATEFPAGYANGYLFFVRDHTLLAQRLDPRNLTLIGAAVPVTEDLETTWFDTGVFSVSSGGTLAYRTRALRGDLRLRWVDRQGRTLSTIAPSQNGDGVRGFGCENYSCWPAVSPDGSRVVVRDAPPDRMGDLWMVDLASGRLTRLTFLESNLSWAVWSPDGSRIAYAGGDFGDTLYERASSDVGDEQVLWKEPGTRHFPTSWSRDGRFLLYHTLNYTKTGSDLWVLPLQGDRKPERLLGEAQDEQRGVFSPDTRWIAYASTETGGQKVFVRPFLPVGPSGVPAVGAGRHQVSNDEGNWASWIGREILFGFFPARTLFTVRVNTSGGVFERGIPQRLFTLPPDSLGVESADGQRFLVAEAGPEGQRTAQVPITVVLNWQEELKHLVPTN